MQEECIFCKIIGKKIPVALVYEDEDALAFLDINPIAKGHTLVIPKKHYENLLVIEQSDLNALMETVQRISISIVKTTGAEGFNVLQNNGEVSGQGIPHVHFHIIPRFKDDNVPIGNAPRGKYEENEIQKIVEMIRNGIPERKVEKVNEESKEVEKEKPKEKSKKRSSKETYWIRRELDLA